MRGESARWRFWQVFGRSETPAFLAVTRPEAYRVIDRTTMWVYLPDFNELIAHWELSGEHFGPESEWTWAYDEITPGEWAEAAVDFPQPDADALHRIRHPERHLTLDQISRIPLAKVVGKRVANEVIRDRERGR